MGAIVPRTIDAWAKTNGFVKNSGSWYLEREETILVADLQKSNYSQRYFLNLSVWLREIEEARFPAERKCHVRTRLTQLVPDSGQVDQLFDDEWLEAHPDAVAMVGSLLDTVVGNVMEVTASLGALQSAEGQVFVRTALVSGSAQALLATSGR